MLRRLACVCLLLCASSAWANVPTTMSLEAALQGNAGGPAPDGNYTITIGLYKDAVGGLPLWTEGPAPITAKNGAFAHLAGSINPLPVALLGTIPQVWIGIAVNNEPEAPRRPLSSTPFALRAALAEGIDCSGCVSVQALDPKVLQPYVKLSALAGVATSGNYADLYGAPKLAKVATTGSYADLTGAPTLAAVAASGAYADLKGGIPLSSCGTGLVLRGFKADGSLDCVAGGGGGAVGADALGAVSNGLLLDLIPDNYVSATVPLGIKDNFPVGVVDTITVPDAGNCTTIAVHIELTNSNTAALKVQLFTPDNQILTLWDKNAKGNSINATYTDKSTLIAGSLAGWVGKNPMGKWSLVVTDSAFFNNGIDGQIVTWNVQVTSLSNKKVKSTGVFQFQNSDEPPFPCTPTQAGGAYYGPKDQTLYICNGKTWWPVVVGVPGLQGSGTTCKDILAKTPGAKDGLYTLNPDGQGDYATWCDMTHDGGGWTLAMRFKSDNKFGWASPYWTDDQLVNEAADGSANPGLNDNAKFKSFLNVTGKEIRGCKGVPGDNKCFAQAMEGDKTLKQLFGENFKDGNGNPTRQTVASFWGDDPQEPNCNGTGINNYQDYGGYGTYSAARFGLVGNNEWDCATTDSAWGFGLYNCSDPNNGCGSGGVFWQGGPCGTNCQQGTLWVR